MEKNSFNRRGFLKSSVIGATGLVAGQKVFAESSDRSTTNSKTEPKIVNRTLGKTGIKVPIVSMGVMRADNPNLVRAAPDKGIKHLDTAHTYQNGRNEEMLGNVLKDYPRDSYTIATKIHPVGQDRRTGLYNEDEFTQESYMEMFNLSMKKDILRRIKIWLPYFASAARTVLINAGETFQSPISCGLICIHMDIEISKRHTAYSPILIFQMIPAVGAIPVQ